MNNAKRSPRISHLSWGYIEVEGYGRFKDAKLFPGGAREWDWRETGTRHTPGILPADVEELLQRGSTIVILTKGFNERLNVHPATLAKLGESGVTTHFLQTEAAVKLYNELRLAESVGGLFHSTC